MSEKYSIEELIVRFLQQDINEDDENAQNIFPCVFLFRLMRLLLNCLLHQYCTSLFRK